jgi:probable HAF family extracellular repeat protein
MRCKNSVAPTAPTRSPSRRGPRPRLDRRRRGRPAHFDTLEGRFLPSYTLTALGTLARSPTTAYGLNNTGQVVGSSVTNQYVRLYDANDRGHTISYKDYLAHGFLWSPTAPNAVDGSMTDLGAPSGGTSEADAINASGQIVGLSTTTVLGFGHATLWQGGQMIDLGTLAGSSSSAARAINGAGWVVGTSGNAFLWTPTGPNGAGAMQDLGVPGTARGINDLGQVVGGQSPSGVSGADRAFLWQNGTLTYLGGSAPGDNSDAMAINSSGEVVGLSRLTSVFLDHATLWQDGTPIDLGVLGGEDSTAYAINDSGQIVGASWYSSSTSATHAFLWSPATPNGASGTMIDLNSLVTGTGWVLTSAEAINDSGQIVGNGVDPHGSAAAFLLTPSTTATQPTAFAPATAGFAGQVGPIPGAPTPFAMAAVAPDGSGPETWDGSSPASDLVPAQVVLDRILDHALADLGGAKPHKSHSLIIRPN